MKKKLFVMWIMILCLFTIGICCYTFFKSNHDYEALWIKEEKWINKVLKETKEKYSLILQKHTTDDIKSSAKSDTIKEHTNTFIVNWFNDG